MDSSIDPTQSISRSRITERLARDRAISGSMPTQANNERFGDGKSFGPRRAVNRKQEENTEQVIEPSETIESGDAEGDSNNVDFFA